MLNYRLLLVTGGFAICFLAVPRRSEAQRVVYYTYSTNNADMTSCRGFDSIHRAVWSKDDKRRDSLNVSYPLVAAVDPQSPAGRTGLVNGDSIVTINRYPTIGQNEPELSLWFIEVGDLNRFDVKRGGQILSLSFRMGTWSTAPGENGGAERRVCRPAR